MSTLYKNMTPDEQLRWVTDFSQFATDKLPLLEKLGDAWEQSDRKDMETGLRLIQAFAVAENFAKSSLQLGDYARRVERLRFYVELIKKEISNGMTVTGNNGEIFAYIPALQHGRRRGRPTREEVYQRKVNAEAANSAEVKTQEKIAQLLGLDIVTDKEAREKNNAELAAEKAAREAEAAKTAPSLFDGANASDGEDKVNGANEVNGDDETPSAPSTTDTPAADAPVSATLPHLDQIRWLLSSDLQTRVDQIRSLRATASASAERAKTLAETGASADEIQPWAQQAQDATLAYEQTYADVDRELAVVWLRLREDETFKKEMADRFKITDTSDLLKLLRPYYNKVSEADPTFTTTTRQWIDDNNPAAVAKREKAAETKKEADAIIKYLRRTDKLPTKKRIAGIEEKLKQLAALIGEDEAATYKPFLDKTIEDNKAYGFRKAAKKDNKEEEE